MRHFLSTLAAAALILCAVSQHASAHPHVWVTMKSEVVYNADGAATGIRHAWTFDDMFSAFAIQGLETKQKGAYTREDLAPLAEVNVTSLKEYDYFTYAKADGKKTELGDAADYWLDYQDEVLTLHFTLPFKTPVKAKDLYLEIYDPTYFVDFSFAEKDGVRLASAPQACKLTTGKPQEMTAEIARKLAEIPAGESIPANSYGAVFANKITVKCP
jgi:ABC-type uncharacterized transport system substrate-binding protein